MAGLEDVQQATHLRQSRLVVHLLHLLLESLGGVLPSRRSQGLVEWLVFFHKRMREKPTKFSDKHDRKRKFQELHAAYKNISPEERQELQPVAKAAKGHKGKHAFGIPLSICRKKAIRTQRITTFKRLQGLPSTARLDAVYKSAVHGCCTELAQLEGHRKLSRQQARQHVIENSAVLERFRSSESACFKQIVKGFKCGLLRNSCE